MKTKLTLEESARLIELGIDQKLASECVSAMKVCASGRGIIRLPETKPIFTLTDLLSILPKRVMIHRDGDDLSMMYQCSGWRVGYSNFAEYCKHTKVAPELIDALYQLLIWAIENDYVKPNKDN